MPFYGNTSAHPPGFNTPLTAEEEKSFQEWKRRYAPRDSGEDYDLRGAFKAGLRPDPGTGHWPDTFKKPNHPTFSIESIYAPYGNPGSWKGETFIPPKEQTPSNPGPQMSAPMHLLNALGIRQDTLGGQIGDRLANQPDNYSMWRLRNDPRFAQNQSMQNYLGPLEHQQFMREMGQTNPLLGMAVGGFSPAYTIGKAVAPGFTQGSTGGSPGEPLQSQPSMDEILRARLGLRQGLFGQRGY